MNRVATDVLLGDLLRGAGFVNLSDMTNAVQVASKTGLPVGRVLVMLGLVTMDVVQAALHGQSLLRDHLIDRDTAVKALCVVSAHRLTFDQALRHIGILPDTDEPTNKLGDLLLTSALITQEQLADALNTSQHLGLPLGRILVLKAVLSEEQIESVLEAQMLLRDGQINRTQALEALRTMRMCGSDIRECLRRLGCEPLACKNTIRLGELLVSAELVSETDLLTALEIGLLEGKPIGQVLIDFGFITEYVVESALRLQSMVGNNNLTAPQAAEALTMVANDGCNIVHAVAEVMAPDVTDEELVGLLQLLSLAGFLTSDECHRLMKFRGTSIFNVVLTETGMMNEATLQVAIRCHLLMNEGLLSTEQAVVALHHWRWSGTSLTDILQNMGWNVAGSHSRDTCPNDAVAMSLPGAAAAAPASAACSDYNAEGQIVSTTIDGPAISNHGTDYTDQFSDEDSLLQIHHTWGAPEVQHTWGIPEIHHSWH